MEPRILLRTHYQAHEPAYLELVVTKCTSATVSAHKVTVVERLFRMIAGKKGFNRAAAGYVVDAAHNLGLLTDRYTWAPTGTLIALTSDLREYSRADIEELDIGRRLAHLRMFLDGDGAALWYLMRELRQEGSITSGSEDANRIATEMFLEVYRQYFELSSSPSDRIRLRGKIDQLRQHQYRGNTGRHKLLFHVNMMHRLGWLDRPDPGSLVYSLSGKGVRAMRVFFEHVRTVADLERRLRDDEAMTLSGRLLAGASLRPEDRGLEAFTTLLTGMYQKVIDLGFSIAPVALLIELVQHHLFTRGIELSYKNASEMLEGFRRMDPKRVRYHVDRKGRPAYLLITP